MKLNFVYNGAGVSGVQAYALYAQKATLLGMSGDNGDLIGYLP